MVNRVRSWFGEAYRHVAFEIALKVAGIILLVGVSLLLGRLAPEAGAGEKEPTTQVAEPSHTPGDPVPGAGKDHPAGTMLTLILENPSGLVPMVSRAFINKQLARINPEGRIRLDAVKHCRIKAFGPHGTPLRLRCKRFDKADTVLDLDTEGLSEVTIICEE